MTHNLSHTAIAVKPRTIAAGPWQPGTICPVCKERRDSLSRCACDYQRSPDAPLAWLVADPDAAHGADLAHQWGHEDATEGNKRNGSIFFICSAEYNSYHQGYNEGLRLRQQLQGDVCQGALDECAWFDEIVGAAPVTMTMSEETLDDMEEEWIGNAFSRQPYAW